MASSSDDEAEPEVRGFRSGARGFLTREKGTGENDRLEASSSGSDDDEDGSQDEGGNDKEKELQVAVADVPFEMLANARSDGIGNHKARARRKVELQKRANKNRPMELPAKKPVPRFREVIQAPKKEIRDPRFEAVTGKFDEHLFKKAYGFVYDEELPAEKEALKKKLKKEKSAERKEELKRQLAKLEGALASEARRREQEARGRERKKKEKEAVKSGKRPFYLKASDKRKQDLIERYKELKAKGKLDTFLAKRRKKNAAKDHRYIPYRRAATETDS